MGMSLSYGKHGRKIKQKNQGIQQSFILVVCAPVHTPRLTGSEDAL